MSPYTGYLTETFVTLLAVCALALLVLWGARRLGVGRPSGAIALYGQLPLDGRRWIYLVRVGDKVFVVGVGEGGFAKLGEVAASELEERADAVRGPATAGSRVRFADLLARARGGDLRTPRPAVGAATAAGDGNVDGDSDGGAGALAGSPPDHLESGERG